MKSKDDKISNDLSKMEIHYSRSSEDVWKQLSNKMQAVNEPKQFHMDKQRPAYAPYLRYAAVAFVILGAALFFSTYQTSVYNSKELTLAHTLPDGSVITLARNAKIEYKPYWFTFSRVLQFEGEAYFDVAKGEQFTVVSNLGSTTVLGTEFNILASESFYGVLCTEGKVSVESKGKQVYLEPGQYAEASKSNGLEPKQIEVKEILAWREGTFLYNHTPLRKVIQDFERHYQTTITLDSGLEKDQYYTGLFPRTVKLEEALDIVTSSFGYRFVKKDSGNYLIRK